MKIFIISILTLFISCFSFAEDTWPEFCDFIKIEYNLEKKEASDPLKFMMEVNITNITTNDLPSYCDVIELVSSSGVLLFGYDGGACYGSLDSGETKKISFEVHRDMASIEKFKLYVKLKNPMNDVNYCSEEQDHWFETPLSIEEIDRSHMSYKTTYYDLMGRKNAEPSAEGFYIVEKIYEDGYKVNEKVYLSAILVN